MKQSELNPILLSDLCDRLIIHLESIRMNPRTVDNYRVVLRRLKRFAAAKGADIYSRELLNEFIDENGFQERSGDPGHMYYRTCKMLHDLAVNALPSISYSRHDAAIPRSHDWNVTTKNYASYLSSKYQSPNTIKTKLDRLKAFLTFLVDSGIQAPQGLTVVVITDFIRHASQTYKAIYKYNLLQSLKDFLSFLYEASLAQDDFSSLLSRLPDPKDSVLPVTYSPIEIRAVLRSIDRDSLMGKRDFAIVQMIAQTGIRAIDVANLKIGDIDFVSNKIRFLQHKTTRYHQLPLTETLFDSLFDYLSARADYACPNIFIRTTDARADLPITPSCVAAVVRKYVRLSGVYTYGKKAGSHALRHSLAVSMTEDDTPFPVISSVLGHSSTEVTKEYAKISLNRLHALSLEVPIYEK